MTIQLAYKILALEAATPRAVPTVRGARVRVIEGVVWATTSGDTRDLWLRAGDEVTIARDGRTVLESSAKSRIELLPPCATNIASIVSFHARVLLQRFENSLGDLRWVPGDLATVVVLLACIAIAFAVGAGFRQTAEPPVPPSTTGTQFANQAPTPARHVMALSLLALPRPVE